MANRLQRAILRFVGKGLFGIDFGIAGADTWQYALDWERAFDTLRRKPDSVDKPYNQVGPFQRAVSVVSRDAASIPWDFYKLDSANEKTGDAIEAHPVSELWQKPNGYMTGNQLLIGSYIAKQIFGEWIWHYPDLQVGAKGSLPAVAESRGRIELLDPRRIARKMVGGTIVLSFRNADGTETPLDPDVVTRSARYNPYNPLVGLPLAAAIMADLIGYHAAASWNARFFNENNGIPTVVLKPALGMAMDPDERNKIVRRWNEKHGADRGVGILPGGWDIEDLGVSQHDMEFSELRQFGRDEILASAGVPPLIAGYLTRPITYNATEQKELYWESTIANFLAEEQAVINFDFLPKIGVAERAFPKWDVVKALLENLTEKTDIARAWFDLGLSKRVINERLEMGWDPSLIPDYEVGYQTFNRLPLDVVFDPTLTSVYVAQKEPAGDAGDNGETAPPAEDDTKKAVRIAGTTEEKREVFWKNLIAKTRDIERRFNRAVRSHMADLTAEVLANIEGVKGYVARSDREDEFASVALLLFDSEKAKKALQALTKPIHGTAMKRGGEGLLAEVHIGGRFDLSSPVAIARLSVLTRKITRIDDTIEEALRLSLVEGLTLGESPQELAKRTREVMKIATGRSMMIARTETGTAFNAGRHTAMEENGIEQHEWLSARDTKVRDQHKKLDGAIVKIGDTFPNTRLRYPLDSRGKAEEIIHCRCAAVPVI